MERNTKSMQWEIPTSLPFILDSGAVIELSYATENFPLQFKIIVWDYFQADGKFWWLVVQAALTKKSESKPLDLCCEKSDFSFRATCVIVSTAFLKKIILHQKRRYQSDPIRNPIRSGVRSDPESDPGFVNGPRTVTAQGAEESYLTVFLVYKFTCTVQL